MRRPFVLRNWDCAVMGQLLEGETPQTWSRWQNLHSWACSSGSSCREEVSHTCPIRVSSASKSLAEKETNKKPLIWHGSIFCYQPRSPNHCLSQLIFLLQCPYLISTFSPRTLCYNCMSWSLFLYWKPFYSFCICSLSPVCRSRSREPKTSC